MSAATGKIYERHVAEVTGGWQPENGRDRHDVFSGNGTRLEVKYGNLTAPLGTAQWKWDLSNKLTPGKYDRMILIGGDGNKPPVRLRYFDVPAEWILAWNQPNLACGCFSQCSPYGYALHNWFTCTREDMALRHGPGKERWADIYTGYQRETLLDWQSKNEAEALRRFNRELSRLSITEFVIRKIQNYGALSSAELDIIRSMSDSARNSVLAALDKYKREQINEKLSSTVICRS